ncbi:MAG: hypothetical protein EOM64_09220, partial [Erysipelotrichia bacterium]|nr:hypothetical protein [Erysipelotrichia bacterium]
LGLVGGIFGIYATLSGYSVGSVALISICNVGPMMAGCLGGPLSGLIAGLIAGIQRLIYGLPEIASGTAIPSSISTLLIGIACGQLKHVNNHRKIHTHNAVLIAAAMEAMHMLIVFLYLWMHTGINPAFEVVSDITLPYLISNIAAFGTMTFVLNMISDYQNTEKHEKTIESELRVATAIQIDTLPKIKPDFPGRKEFSISASMNTAKEVGGDFYDVFFIDDNHVVFLIADVSGKGVPAALFMVIAKTLLKNNLMNGLSAAEACTRTNHQLCESSGIDMFVTAWVGVLDISSGRMKFVNAGHNPPLLKRAGRPAEFLRTRGGFVLAGIDHFQYHENELFLSDGDFLFLYTDGITEAMNHNYQQHGDIRLQLLMNHADHSMNPDRILEKVDQDVKEHAGDAEQSDDQTMMGVLISGSYQRIKVKPGDDTVHQIYTFAEQLMEERQVPENIKHSSVQIIDKLYSGISKYIEDYLSVGVSCYPGHVSLQMEYSGKHISLSTAETIHDRQMPEILDKLDLQNNSVYNLNDEVQYTIDNRRNIFTITKNYPTERG